MTPGDVAELVASVAPELAGLYVVFSSATCPSLAKVVHTLGGTVANLDLRLREFIVPWRGRGPAMLLNDRLLREKAAVPANYPASREEVEGWTFGRVALHEAAHILELEPPYYGGPDGGGEPYPPELLEQMAANLNTPLKDAVTPGWKPWDGHGPTWLRLVCHLAYRVRAMGLDISPAAVVSDHRMYGLSNPFFYARELGHEPQAYLGRPLCELLTEPLPAGFQALWDSDTREPEVRP